MGMRSISLAIIALILIVPAQADTTTYTYTGNTLTNLLGTTAISFYSPFSSCPNVPPAQCALEVQFTLPQPLAPNLFDQYVSPDFWFFDVFVTSIHSSLLFADETTASSLATKTFLVTTDSSGNITNWGVLFKDDSFVGTLAPQEVLVISNNGQDVAEQFLAVNGLQLEAELTNAGNPGTWTSFTTGSGGGSVPEPSSLMLLAAGALGVLIRRRRIGRS